jgi:hypothetical protein
MKSNSSQSWALSYKTPLESSLLSTNHKASTTVPLLSLLGSSSTSTLSSLSQSSCSRSRLKLINSENFISKASTRVITLGLDLHKLETLLCMTGMEYCTDNVIALKNFRRFSGMASQRKNSVKNLDRDEWEEIADALNDLMCNAPRMPLKLIAHIHTTIGLIRQSMARYDCAISAFTKALFLYKKMETTKEIEVALLISRIGVAKTLKGNSHEGTKMLKKALQIYRCAGLSENHIYLMSAKLELEGLKSCLHVDSANER